MFQLFSNARGPAVAAILSVALLMLLTGCIWSERPFLFEKLGPPDTPLLGNRTYTAFKYVDGPVGQKPTRESDVHLTLQDGVYTIHQNNKKVKFRLFNISRVLPKIGPEIKQDYIMESVIENYDGKNKNNNIYKYDYVFYSIKTRAFIVYDQSCKKIYDNDDSYPDFSDSEISKDNCKAESYGQVNGAALNMYLNNVFGEGSDDNKEISSTVFALKMTK